VADDCVPRKYVVLLDYVLPASVTIREGYKAISKA
jgi:hypothetical protein